MVLTSWLTVAALQLELYYPILVAIES